MLEVDKVLGSDLGAHVLAIAAAGFVCSRQICFLGSSVIRIQVLSGGEKNTVFLANASKLF